MDNPPLRSDAAAWQGLVRSDPNKALLVWVNAEKKRSWKRPRYSTDFNHPGPEGVGANWNWKSFLELNPPDGELSDSDGDDIGFHPYAGPSNAQSVVPPNQNVYLNGGKKNVYLNGGNVNVYMNLDTGGNSGQTEPSTNTTRTHAVDGPGSPRDGNFCEDRLPWHLMCLPKPLQSFTKWTYHVTMREIALSQGSSPIDVNDL